MDKTEPGKESTEDVTRESLIALSYRVPDLTAEKSLKNMAGGEIVGALIHDEDEKYRSKLISLSCSPSPDVKVLPVLPAQPDAWLGQ